MNISSLQRCDWCGTDPLYVDYHDKEWGVPVHDETRHFEFLTLESAQAGLSWITVLRKRENYRIAFAGFDAVKVAAFCKNDVDELLQNPGIIRNRLKIEAAISNARNFLNIQQKYGSFDQYIWGFTDGRTILNRFETMKELPSTSPWSDRISADLKARGFKFVGSTIIYAHLQAIGVVNDHLLKCYRREEIINGKY